MRLPFLLTLLLVSPTLSAQPTMPPLGSGGGPGGDIGESIAADMATSEYAVVGTFEQTATFGSVSVTSADAPSSRSDAFVVRYGADGVARWARRMGTGVFNDFGAGVALTPRPFMDAGSVYVSGYFTGIATFDGGANPSVSLTTRSDFDAFLAKYNAQGDLLWVEQAGGPEQDTGRGIAIDSHGYVLWTGSFTGTSTWGTGTAAVTRTSAGGSDGFLARYFPDGTLDRLVTVGGDESDDLRSVAASPYSAPGSAAYVTGTFRSVAIFGATPLQSRGLSDLAVVSILDDGTTEWARQVGGSGNDYARGIAVTRDGVIGVGGSFENTLLVGTDVLTSAGFSDAILAVYYTDGSEAGAFRGGGEGFDIANGVAATPFFPIPTLGGDPSRPVFVLTGYIDGAATFGQTPLVAQSTDAFAAVYPAPFTDDPTTADLFLVGGSSSDRGNAAAFVDFGQEVLLTGSYRGTVSFGGTTATSAGSNDVFVARIPLCPTYSCPETAAEPPAVRNGTRLAVTPNPSRTPTLTLSLDAPADVVVEVIDALGRVQAIAHRGPLASGDTRLPLGRLVPGVYVARVRGAVEARQPFVVVR